MKKAIVKIRIGNRERILEGEKAEAAVIAVKFALESMRASKSINKDGIDIIDTNSPRGFSYSKAFLEAWDHNLRNPIEIADYILKKRNSRL